MRNTGPDIIQYRLQLVYIAKSLLFYCFLRFFSGEIKESFLFMRELALFSAADKLRHYQTEIAPRLEEGCIVITDRYVFSAYSYFLGRGINDIEWLMQINKFLPMPDITFYIDLPVDTAIKRITERDGNINKKEEENITRLESVRKTFLSQPWGKLDNYKIIDGQKELEKKEQEILDIFNELLKKG